MSLAARVSSLTPEQRALFEALRKERREPPPATLPARLPPVRPLSGPSGVGDWPLTADQERLWRMHRQRPGLVSWNVDAGSHVTGALDVPRFLAALHRLLQRHAAFRTTFVEPEDSEGRPIQRVHPELAPAWTVIDVSALPSDRRETEGLLAIHDHTRDPFDLERGPLLRVALVRLGEREHLYLVTLHHLVTDWITYQIFFAELMAIYDALGAGVPPPLPPVPVQFPDYALWEGEAWGPQALEEEGRYWRGALEGFQLTLDLPSDRQRPAVQSQRGGLHRLALGAERSERLRALARKEGATSFMAVLAALYALLWRCTGRERLIVGSNSANRPLAELLPVAGFFLTQVPFAADLAGDPDFRELLARARRSALAAYGHQSFPFSRLIEALGASDDGSRNPVVQVLLLILEGESEGRSADLAFRPVGLYDGNSRWDLMFGLYDYHDAGFSGPLEYNADLFEPATIERLAALFYRIVDAVTADPGVRLSQLPAWEGR